MLLVFPPNKNGGQGFPFAGGGSTMAPPRVAVSDL